MAFEPNRGQADARVQFIGRGRGMTVFLTRREIAMRVGNSSRARSDAAGSAITLRLAGATDFSWRGGGKLRGESNYFVGDDPRAWQRHVPHFARAEAQSAAPGVGVVIYGNDDGVEYDLRLAPGADASKLRLGISGPDDMRLASDGDLLLRVGGNDLRMKKPDVYEDWLASAPDSPKTTGRRERKRIGGRYVLEPDGSVGFRVGPHDANATLVIDPSLSVAYATFLGGAGTDAATSVALDATGKVYVGGTTTSSTTFPLASANRIGPATGPAQYFVAKFDPAVTGPNSLLYLTFLGGSANQAGGLIAVDGSGRVAITGTTTSVDFPVTDSSRPTSGLTSGDGNDVTVSELDATGSTLVFSTLFGGSGAESQNGAGGITLDKSGNVYVASDTQTTAVNPNSTNLPVTPGAFLTVWDGQVSDGFLAVFQPPALAGGAPILKYCSYLGTNSIGSASVGGIAVDASANAYIAGSTDNAASGFPVKNALQAGYGGGDSDAFLMRISPAGQGAADLVYATLLGGSGADQALAVAVDSASPPNAYVTGTTQSANFPVAGANAPYQGTLRANMLVNGSANAFLAVVAQDGITGATSLAYSTYLGGSARDAGQAVAVAAPNQVYVAGTTSSQDFPLHDNLQPFNGAADAFVAKFDPTSSGAASLIYATPLAGTSPPGGTASAFGNGIAADGAGHLYVAGQTTAADFPTAVTTASDLNGFQQTCVSCQQAPPASDAFVAEIAESSVQAPSVYFDVGKVSFPPVPVGTVNAPQSVAVLNGGEAALTITDIRILGANADDFSLNGQGTCIGPAISPGPVPQCSFEVGFTPSLVGPETAVLSVSDNAPGNPQVLEIIGAGQGPLAAVSPPSLDFGNQSMNTISDQRAITVTNVGDQSLTITSVQEAGPDASQFPLQTNTCSPNTLLPGGAGCTVSVAFAPTATGSFLAEIDVKDNSGGSTSAVQVVSLAGTGTAPAPIAKFLPASMTLGFGTVTVGTTSGTQSVTLANVGSAALSLTSVAIAGANAPDFAIAAAGTTCPAAGGTVAIGASCTVAVQFAPQSAGTSKSASLTFADNAASSPQQVLLSGTATDAASLQVSPANLTFTAQSEGTASAPQTVTLSNTSTAPASIGTITVSGANAGDFALQNPCAPSLGAGKSCQLSVSFSPAVSTPAGSRSAALNIPAGNPQTVTLAGTATQASISLPTSINFGSQLAGTSGTPQPVNVANNSSGPLAGDLLLNSVTTTGANPGDFVLSTDHCTGSMTPPGQTCAIQVAFQPAQAATCGAAGGARSATLLLTDNAPGSPHSIPLSGTATDFCFGSATGQPVTASIQRGQSATYSLEMDSSAGFTGSVSLACAGAPPAGTCTITTDPPSMPPTVQVSPGIPGQFQVVVTTAAGLFPVGKLAPRKFPPLPAPKPTCWLVAIWLAMLAAWTVRTFRPAAGATRSRHSDFMKIAHVGVLLFALALGMAACGGGGGGASDPLPAGTPPGTYTVTLIATGPAGVARTIPLSLTVQ
jgi:Abnormal spindle-like microcephaly-assoc'd, ASPM-SPD-2-Hydin/HYDIN/CFA65/VesB-like, Ig-like domain/Beta-propeller repeat